MIRYPLRDYRPADGAQGWQRQAGDWDATMIWTGLSVTVCGHLLSLDRDERTKTARVVERALDGHVTGAVDREAIRVAADLLVRRARRCLGDWTVLPLEDDA